MTNIKFFSFNVSLLFVRKSRKLSQKNHSWGMMDQNFLSKWSKRSLSIIFIMINYNADQKMPLSFDPDHKNAPSFCQIKKCSFCFDPNSEPKKKCFFFWFLFYWSRSKKNPLFDPDQKPIPFFWMSIKNLRQFFWSGWKNHFFIQIIFHYFCSKKFLIRMVFLIWFNN